MRHSKSRLEALSDGVFAFAATLLVVSLEVPNSFELLKQNMSGFLGFGISFFVLVMLWRTHYNFFRRHDLIDNWVIALNMILLFVILFFIYPMKFLINLSTRHGNIRIRVEEFGELFMMYGLGFVAVFLVLSLMYFYVGKNKHELENRKELNFYGRHFMIFVVTGLISIILATLNIGLRFGLPGFAYGLIGPLAFLHGKYYGDEMTTSAL